MGPLVIGLKDREAFRFQRKPSEMIIDGLICSILYCLGFIYTEKYMRWWYYLHVNDILTTKVRCIFLLVTEFGETIH